MAKIYEQAKSIHEAGEGEELLLWVLHKLW